MVNGFNPPTMSSRIWQRQSNCLSSSSCRSLLLIGMVVTDSIPTSVQATKDHIGPTQEWSVITISKRNRIQQLKSDEGVLVIVALENTPHFQDPTVSNQGHHVEPASHVRHQRSKVFHMVCGARIPSWMSSQDAIVMGQQQILVQNITRSAHWNHQRQSHFHAHQLSPMAAVPPLTFLGLC